MKTLNNDTIVAVSTPVGEGGIGIVRLSGPKSLRIADRLFISKNGGKPSEYGAYSIRYGHIIKPSGPDEGVIDEVLLTVMRGPRSYTREDVVEINCHGGIVPLRKVFEETVALGARPAEPGEFTRRAFLNGRIDLAQAEAVCDVIAARTEASLRVAVGHLEGHFSGEIKKERERLADILKDIEADIDFSDDDIDRYPRKETAERLSGISDALKRILDTQGAGMLLKEGITCVICGKPNTGKSSLMNTLLGRNRAIVTSVPGTTRDAIEEWASIKGIAVRLVDTAGIMKSRNIVEKKGIEKARHYLKTADMVILMLDMSRRLDKRDLEVIKRVPRGRTVAVANKSDLRHRLSVGRAKKLLNNADILVISVTKKKNIDKLEDTIAGRIWSGKVIQPEPFFLNNVRHKKAIIKALRDVKSAAAVLYKELPPELAAADLKSAVSSLGLITGESVDIDILDRIFEKFCVGK
ncbi:MAG: tRNA uridine-5-carboxymethylaminomethyl(34) synthesis GTPase MnmE [Candidatus Omnitrophota bacterium]